MDRKVTFYGPNPRLAFTRWMRRVFPDGRPVKVYFGHGFHSELDTIIGSEGFGHVRDERGVLLRIPHIGGVKIGNDVWLGANVVIDRGTIFCTEIGDGTKIGAMSHIAHNVIIGKHVVIAAQAQICGSVEIGDYSYIGAGTMIKPSIKIGSNCLIGIGSVVTKDIPDGMVAYGNPCVVQRPNQPQYPEDEKEGKGV